VTAHRPRVRQLPAVVVLAVTGFGLLLAATLDWQVGALVVGIALVLAGALRLSLPARTAGWLVVRTRGLDAAFLLSVGFALVVLANTIPER
jgi:hypothetical protein